MRRADGEMQQKIEALIQEEADPRERARLLILYQIASVLIDNVSAVRETTQEFKDHRLEYEAHITREEALINQGRGLWRALGAVIVVVQATLGYLYVDHMDSLKMMQGTINSHAQQLEVIAERHRLEENAGRRP